MRHKKLRYVVDEQGRKESVVLSYKEYQELFQHIPAPSYGGVSGPPQRLRGCPGPPSLHRPRRSRRQDRGLCPQGLGVG